METIVAEKAPPAIGPYCAGKRVGNQIWCSGQTAWDPVAGKLVSEDIGEQTKKTIENLKAVLEAAGSSLDKVFKCTVYMTDLNEFAAMNAAFSMMSLIWLPDSSNRSAKKSRSQRASETSAGISAVARQNSPSFSNT